MSVAPASSSHRSTIHAVPKPVRRSQTRQGPLATGLVAKRLAAAEGHLIEDIAADLEAVDALAVAKQVDRRRDPLVVEMVRLFGAIEHDLSASAASRALATRGKALGCEAIRLDRIKDEHDERAEHQTVASIAAGRIVVTVHETLLTGVEP